MNNQERVWKIGYMVGVFVVVFLAVISVKEIISLRYVGRDTQIINTISVNGKGEAVSIPDIATFSFSVTETGKTVDEAQSKATTKINDALKAVKAGGVAEKDIKTLSYSINPHYEYNQITCITYPCPSGKSVLTGYDVSQSVEVKVRDLTKAGALFETIGAVGVQNVNGLAFSIDDIDTVREKARADAVANAKTKAQKIAQQLGVSLVRITSFYDSSDQGVLPYADSAMGGGMMAMKASAPPEIPTGEQKITSQITITYEIR